MPVEGRIVSAFYRSQKTSMPKLFFAIRTPEGKKVFPEPIPSPIRPYFYCREEDASIVGEKLRLTELDDSNFHIVPTNLELGIGEGKACRVDMWEPWRVGSLKRWFRERSGIELYEADIPYIRRLRIDLGLGAGIRIDGGKISPYNGPLPAPKLLFIDTEFDDSAGFPEVPGESACLCIGTVDEEGNENFFTWQFGEKAESTMFTEFFEYAKEFDYLVVWNKDFEAKKLTGSCKKLDIWLEWRIFRWVDLAEFYKLYHQKTYYEQLQIAYKLTLDKFRGKLERLGILKHERIERTPPYYKLWKNNPERLKEINLSHAYALYVMENAMEVIKLYSDVADEIGLFIDFTVYNSHIVDTLALRYANRCNKKWVISSTKPYVGKKKGIKGAVVFPPKRGIHAFVYLFDFTSLYNRIIQSYLLDPITYDKWDGTFTENGIEEYVEFAKVFGSVYGIDVEGRGRLPIFPAILHQMEQRRNYLKEQRKKHPHGSSEYEMYDQQQKAAKVILLACYGVLTMSSSRWTVLKKIPDEMMLIVEDGANLENLEIDCRVPNKPEEKFAGMITYIARTALVKTRNLFNDDKDVNVIYGDTDGVFQAPLKLINSEKTYRNLTDEDLIMLIEFGDMYIQKLEGLYEKEFEAGIGIKLEKIFDRAVFGKAKKNYYSRVIWDEDTGWQRDTDGNLTWYECTKGLPLVRSDRCEFLKKYQKKTLQTLLDDPKALYPMWRKAIIGFFDNEHDHELILRIGVKKPLDQYKNVTAAVRAARMLVERGQKVRIGEKVAFIIVDVKGGKGVPEPVDDTLLPEEAIELLPRRPTRKALEYYWKRRIWKNIKPFLELVLTEREIMKIEMIKDGTTMIDAWLKQKT